MVENVLEFWLGAPATNVGELRAKIKRWYMGGPGVDAEIRERFAPLVERALAGELDDWTATPRGQLALIILVDQFTRSVYRDDPRTYAGDPKAQALAVDAFDRGLDRELAIEEQNFLRMPLLHAEDLALQDRAARETTRFYAAVPEWSKPVWAMGVEQGEKYRALIAKFGRFPHRNAILGRTSTPDEEAFLVDWQQKMPPSGATSL